MAAELLMRQLLKLDGIKVDGEARVQRKAEVGFSSFTFFNLSASLTMYKSLIMNKV